MKKSIFSFLTLSLVLMNFSSFSEAGTQTVRFSKATHETIDTILHLSRSNGCDNGGDEDWRCETTVENRSGTIDISRCKDQPEKWACYEDIKESCEERNSGRTTNHSYRRFTGVCGSLSDCW